MVPHWDHPLPDQDCPKIIHIGSGRPRREKIAQSLESRNDIERFAADGFQQYIFESTPLIKSGVIVTQNNEVAGDE